MFASLPPQVKTIYARADSGFYCGEAVEAYQKGRAQFIISARKTSRLVDELKAAPIGSGPRAPTPMVNASFAISRRAGRQIIGSSPCAT